MIMKKKILLFLSISAAAVMLASCGESYEDKAKEWLRSNVEHIVNINDNHQVLYCVKNETLIKVNLATGESVPYMSFMGDKQYTFNHVKCVFPKDKGYEEDRDKPASTKFAVIGWRDYVNRTALLFDAETEKVKTICTGTDVEGHGEFLICTTQETDYLDGVWVEGKIVSYDLYYAANGKRVEFTTFTGNAGRNNIQMDLCIGEDGSVVGKYYYTKYGLKKPLGLKGEIDQDGNMTLHTAWVGLGNTEVWNGVLRGDTFEGQYSLDVAYGNDVYRDFTLIQQ